MKILKFLGIHPSTIICQRWRDSHVTSLSHVSKFSSVTVTSLSRIFRDRGVTLTSLSLSRHLCYLLQDRNHFLSENAFRDFELNQVCEEKCAEDTFECITSCDFNDFECFAICLRAEITCFNREFDSWSDFALKNVRLSMWWRLSYWMWELWQSNMWNKHYRNDNNCKICQRSCTTSVYKIFK